jgi:hypothetical protein
LFQLGVPRLRPKHFNRLKLISDYFNRLTG